MHCTSTVFQRSVKKIPHGMALDLTNATVVVTFAAIAIEVKYLSSSS